MTFISRFWRLARRPVFATALLALSRLQPALAQQPDVPAEFARLEGAWNAAHLAGDAQALDHLWSDDIVIIVPRMAPLSKSSALGMYRRGGAKFTRFETSALRTRVVGDMAVVTGRLLRTRDFNGRVASEDWQFTKVYARGPSGWRVVSYHASESPE